MKYWAYAIFIIGIVWTVSAPEQDHFWSILGGFSVSFLGYILFIKEDVRWNFPTIILLAILPRVLLIPWFPNLSDDVYRFYWDGLIALEGYNPYAFSPTELIGELDVNIFLPVFEKLNSPEYFSVYPPVNQWMYEIAASGSSNIQSFAMILKTEYLILEFVGIIFLPLLCRFLWNNMNVAFLYLLNPLVIIEGIGQLHIEVVSVSFLIACLYFGIVKNHWLKSGAFYGLTVACKITPLLIGPYFLWRLWSKKLIKFLITGGLIMLVVFLPLIWSGYAAHFLDSIDLYFRRFEFNASLYYVFRWFGFQFSGYNLIAYLGPILSCLVLGSILLFANRSAGKNWHIWIRYMMLGWAIYLLLATIVHPWYVIPLLFLGVLSDTRFPLIWSFLVILSYASYQNIPFKEEYGWVVIEYVLLGAAIIWDCRKQLN